MDAYRELSGMAGAVNAHPENLYKQLASQKREQWVKSVMLRLVRTGEGTRDTRQRQRKGALLEMAKDSVEREAIEAVINALVNGRLLVSDRIDNQDVVDLSHEALMRSWKRLVTWREGDQEVRRIVDAIEDAKRKWIEQGKKRRDLLEGRLLKDAGRLLKDAPAEVFGAKGFIRKSLWVRRSEFASWMIIPLLVLGVPAEYLWREESIKRDYVRIEQLNNGEQGERTAVISLAGGCWAKEKYWPNRIDNREIRRYFWERVFGNCRSLHNAKLEKSKLGDMWRYTPSDMRGHSGIRTEQSDPSGIDYWDVNLSGADLKEANLSGADLKDVNLSGADLRNANLSSADLYGADLSGANLRNAKLSGASFWWTNLKDIKWDENTIWPAIQRWETVENIPPALKQQLGLK